LAGFQQNGKNPHALRPEMLFARARKPPVYPSAAPSVDETAVVFQTIRFDPVNSTYPN
jgi:hypothetical protein